MRRTPSTWNGSPEWEAQARASRSGGQVESELDHRQRLQRLVARAGQHGCHDLADRPLDRAVRRQRHDRAVVVALDESGADDLGDDGQAGAGRGGQHAGRLPTASTDTVRGCCGDPALPDADRARRPGAPGLRRLCPAHPLQRARQPRDARAARGCDGGRARRPRGPAAGPRRCRRHAGAPHPCAVRPLPPPASHARADARAARRRDLRPGRRRAHRGRARRGPRPRTRGPGGPDGHRHRRALPRRPGPRLARRGRPARRRPRGRRTASLPRRRRPRPRARCAGGGDVRRRRPGARTLRPLRRRPPSRPPSPRSSRRTAPSRSRRAWCCSSPASPAAASRRSPAR